MIIRKSGKWKWAGVAGIALIAVIIGSIFFPNAEPTMSREKSVKQLYEAAGNSAVETTVIAADDHSDLYKIYYPRKLDKPSAVIVWGNGTGALPDNYDPLLTHLASWGFIVIDTFSKTTGTGKEILEAAEYMIAENSVKTSLFYKKINIGKIGSAGHSQGSTGVINAHTNYENGKVFKTVVSIALPALKWCDPKDVYDTSLIKVPFFVFAGSRDFIVSPSSSNRQAIDNTSSTLSALAATAIGAGHTEIEKDGGKHRGYLTAWMRYQLMGDEQAMRAFVGSAAEIAADPDIKLIVAKNLSK
ncbi:alpha/beta hydrolase [Paenibacillaceae bacterium]|nr:alpha/beta hydrolase [Paenibacillaceae bacterium]